MNGIIGMHELVAALEVKIGLKQEVASDVARRVLNYFGYGETIIDNMLDQEDRRLFYFLQDYGFMGTDWDETFLLNGRGWRIFYWRLNIAKIREFSKIVEEEPDEEISGVYDSLPDQAWVREEAG
jgi:hypothetical protein